MLEKIKDEQGNSSFFFLILLPLTVLVLLLIFENAQLRRDELDFVRACENNLDLTLADFDRKLWHEFGLWGVENSLLNQHSSELEQNYAQNIYDSKIKISSTADLDDPDNLRRQILRHMSIRGPFLITEELITRFTDFQLLGQTIAQSSAWSEIANSDNFIDPEVIIDNPDSFAGNASDLDLEISEDELENLSEAELNGLTKTALAVLGEIISGAKEMIIPYYESTGNEVPADPLAPNSLHKIAEFSEGFLINYDLPVISRLQIQEYLFNYYTMQCNQLELNGEQISLQTPDGRLHYELSSAGRKNEVEQIIFNKDNPEKAASTAKGTIRGVCFGYHFISNYYDQAKQNIYLAEATATCTLIALASLGHVILEPQPLVYLFMLIDSLHEAILDTNQLLDGKEVTFIVKDYKIQLNYRDFMRVFSVFNSEEKLLTGINRIRKKTIPGVYVTGFLLEANFRKSSLRMSREFSDYVAEN